MKGIILASLATVLSFILATAMLRILRIERRAKALIGVYVVGVVVIVATDLATPNDLTFLAQPLIATPSWFDLASALFFFAAAFFGGVLQIYNLADRGFSLRILIDISEQKHSRIAGAALFGGYSGGRGIEWMYRKRIDDLLRAKFITIDGDIVTATQRGAVTARVFGLFRRIFNVETAP